MTNWRNEYMVQWCRDPDPLDDLALEYLKNTEDHDWRVCRHHKGNMAIPVTLEERALCSRFANSEYRRLRDIAMGTGMQGSLWQAIRRAERHFSETYIPPKGSALSNPVHKTVDIAPHSHDT